MNSLLYLILHDCFHLACPACKNWISLHVTVNTSNASSCLPVTFSNGLVATGIVLCSHQTAEYGRRMAGMVHVRWKLSPKATSISTGRFTIIGASAVQQQQRSHLFRQSLEFYRCCLLYKLMLKKCWDNLLANCNCFDWIKYVGSNATQIPNEYNFIKKFVTSLAKGKILPPILKQLKWMDNANHILQLKYQKRPTHG